MNKDNTHTHARAHCVKDFYIFIICFYNDGFSSLMPCTSLRVGVAGKVHTNSKEVGMDRSGEGGGERWPPLHK